MNAVFGGELWGPPSTEVDEEFRRYIMLEPTSSFESDWDYCTSSHKGSYINNDSLGVDLIRFIQRQVESREPFSIIRMNDGEGCIFFNAAFPNYPALNRYVVERISEIIFGSPRVVWENAVAFFDLLANSCLNADIIGIPERDFPSRRLNKEAPGQVDVRAVCGVKAQLRWLAQESRRGVIDTTVSFASAWLSKYLLPHYPSICKMFPVIALVTGNPGLGDALAVSCGVAHVIEIGVPTQRALKLKGEENRSHYPDRFEEVMRRLSEIPAGSLVLVAAGLLAKPYCAQVKRFGSSAIDIGHVADIWAGKASRPGVSDEFVKRWTLVQSSIT